jgi:hypothetical protein
MVHIQVLRQEDTMQVLPYLAVVVDGLLPHTEGQPSSVKSQRRPIYWQGMRKGSNCKFREAASRASETRETLQFVGQERKTIAKL